MSRRAGRATAGCRIAASHIQAHSLCLPHSEPNPSNPLRWRMVSMCCAAHQADISAHGGGALNYINPALPVAVPSPFPSPRRCSRAASLLRPPPPTTGAPTSTSPRSEVCIRSFNSVPPVLVPPYVLDLVFRVSRLVCVCRMVPNQFQVLAGDDEEDQVVDVFGAEEIGVLEHFADGPVDFLAYHNGPAPVLQLPVADGLELPVNNPLQIPVNNPLQIPVNKAALTADALPPAAFAPVHEDPTADDNKNPWVEVAPRRRPRNPNAPREVFPLEPEVKVCDREVLWEVKGGSLRSKRKWSQARKSGCMSTDNGLAYFVY